MATKRAQKTLKRIKKAKRATRTKDKGDVKRGRLPAGVTPSAYRGALEVAMLNALMKLEEDTGYTVKSLMLSRVPVRPGLISTKLDRVTIQT